METKRLAFPEERDLEAAPPRQRRFYHRLRGRLRRLIERAHVPAHLVDYVLLAPDLFALLVRLLMDRRVPSWVKSRVAMALTYFMSPVDILPDFLPVGYVDDVIVAAVVVHALAAGVNAIRPEVLAEHWEGGADLLPTLRTLSRRAEDVLGRGLRLAGLVAKRVGRSIVSLPSEQERAEQSSIQ